MTGAVKLTSDMLNRPGRVEGLVRGIAKGDRLGQVVGRLHHRSSGASVSVVMHAWST